MPEIRRRRAWLYVCAVFVIWAIAPEIRRLIDWRVGFNSISIVSVLPLASLVPAALLVPWTMKRVRRDVLVCIWLWLGAFGYGLAVALASGNTIPGLFALAGFILPPCFGLFLAATRDSTIGLYDRISGLLLAIATPVAAYAIFQFVAPPPWDVAWVLSSNIDSIGSPRPFGLRAFGTLNAPGPLADFLAMILILNFPRLTMHSRLRIAQFAVVTLALLLTEGRSSWVALVVGILAYVLFTPHRARNLTILAASGVLVTGLVVGVSAALGTSQASDEFSQRASTFLNIQDDRSFRERQTYFGERLSEALAEPIGQGLGLIGTAAKLGSTGVTADFDNGYIARLTELGYFGFACYLATLGFALVAAFRRFRTARASGTEADVRAIAAVISLQCALLFLDLSSDHHNSLNGIFFWLSIAIAMKAPELAAVRLGDRTRPRGVAQHA